MSAQNEVGCKKLFFIFTMSKNWDLPRSVPCTESPWPSEIVKQVLGFSEMWGI